MRAETTTPFVAPAASLSGATTSTPAAPLPNAVGVCFYEHLFDDWSLRHEIVPWLAPDVREAVLPLWEQRLDADKLSELRRLLAQVVPNEPWRELRGVA